MTRKQTEHLKRAFLDQFRLTGNVSDACRVAGIGSRKTVYAWQENDDEFVHEYREAEIVSTERLEREAFRRAAEGTEKPVYQGGLHVGTIREYSDTLLIFLLKARKPTVYRDRLDVTSDGQPLIKALEGVNVDRV